MPLFRDYMGGGISAGTSKAMGGSLALTVSAAGTTIATATDLGASKNVVTTVSASTAGVQLADMVAGESQTVYNATTTPVKVYPGATTVGINQVGVGNAVYLPGYTFCEFHAVSATLVLANLSA